MSPTRFTHHIAVTKEVWEKLKLEAARQNIFVGDLIEKIIGDLYERDRGERNRTETGNPSETSKPNSTAISTSVSSIPKTTPAKRIIKIRI